MFWTIDSKTPSPVTLCESCALHATNNGIARGMDTTFGSMEEAALLMDALLSTVGYTMDLTSSDIGECEHCGQAKQEVTG